MQVWNVLHAAPWKCRTKQIAKKSLSGHHRTILLGYIFATKACIDNRKKVVKQQCLPHMSTLYGELRPTSGWDLLASLGHACKFQRVSRLGSVTARHSSSGRQPNFAALNRGCHLYSAGRPSRWALAHVSSLESVTKLTTKKGRPAMRTWRAGWDTGRGCVDQASPAPDPVGSPPGERLWDRESLHPTSTSISTCTVVSNTDTKYQVRVHCMPLLNMNPSISHLIILK